MEVRCFHTPRFYCTAACSLAHQKQTTLTLSREFLHDSVFAPKNRESVFLRRETNVSGEKKVLLIRFPLHANKNRVVFYLYNLIAR